MGILKTTSAKGRGVNIRSCLAFAEASITSKLAYGAPATANLGQNMIYQFDNPSQLATRHTMALKKALAIPNHVPNYVLLPEIGRLPLPSILKARALNFAVRTIHSPNPHPLDKLLLQPQDTLHVEHIAVRNPPFSYNVKGPLEGLGVVKVDKKARQAALHLKFAGKISRESLWEGKKEDHPPSHLKALTLELIEKQVGDNTIVIYTDGSVYTDSNKAGAAAIIKHKGLCIEAMTGANPSASSTEAEMVALLLALKKCNDNTLDMTGIQHINIYTDSKALTHLIETRYPRDHIELLGAIKTEAANLAAAKIQILVQWIPSHVDLSGNEAADRAAKTASNLPNTSDFGRPKTHFRGQINKLCRAEFQEWALGKLRGSKNRLAEFYQLVNPELKPQKHSHSIPRVLEQLVLFLRINSLSICPMIHTNYCAACDMVPFSTTHYLLECPSTTEVVKKTHKTNAPG